MSQQVTAKLKYLHIAPRKVRLVATAIKGLSANEAEAQLLFRVQHSSGPILKLLRSAIANAKNNQKLNPDKLFVKSISVDQGPILERFLPRAQGRATPLQKKMSHVTIVLEERAEAKMPRFNIVLPEKAKKTKKPKASKLKTDKDKKETEQRPAPRPEKVGFFKRMFRRKSV